MNVRGGLDLTTGAGIGPDGIQANVVRFGFNLGPKFAIKTLIVDIGWNFFIIPIGLLFVNHKKISY